MRNWVVTGLILLVVGLVGSGITFGVKGDFSFGTEKIEQHRSIAGEGIRNIDIYIGSADLKLVPGTGSDVRASLTGRVSKKYIDKLAVNLEKEGDTLRVSFKEKFGFNFGLSIMSVSLELEVPEQQYSQLKLVSGSGNVTVANLAVANEVGIQVLSGDVNVNSLQSRLLSVKLGSGDVKLSDVDAELAVSTGSGDIKVAQKAIVLPAAIRTGSGDVAYLTDEQPNNAEISYRSGSGDVYNGWDAGKGSKDDGGVRHITFGTGAVPVQIHTGSGDLAIMKR